MHRFVIAALVVMLISTSPLAEIPQVLGYQGRITENTGVPVANGTYSMQFRIYDAETGGTLLWDSGALSVETNAGVFAVMLGESPQPVLNLAFDQDYWLLVTYRGEDQLPRKRLGSVGYAYMASGLVPGTEVSGSVTTGTLAAMKVENTATSGTNYGVYGVSASTSGRALFGQATATSGSAYGVYAISSATTGRGVFGYATSTTGQAYGVFGQTSSTVGRAVYGLAGSTTGVNYGVYGYTSSPSGYAGYFQGDAWVTGDLTVNGTLNGPGIGDITAVTAGTGLDGGGTSGDVTLDVEVPLGLTASATTAAIVGGSNTATSGAAYGVRGTSASTAGRALQGEATATTGVTYGVYATSAATTGRGVFGYATSTTGQAYGVLGQSSSTVGRAVYGLASATTGVNYGVYGYTGSPSGYAGYFQGDARVTGDLTVNGTLIGPSIGDITAVTAGTGLDGGGTSGDVTLDVEVPLALTGDAALAGIVRGTNSSTSGRGVYGEATATTGNAYGVYGKSESTSGRGVFGEASATSGTTYGVYGSSASSSGRSVYGLAAATSGTSYGGYFESVSPTGRGVYGYASDGAGTNYGVYGKTESPSGYAGYFQGDARVTGDLTVDGALTLPGGVGDITAVTAGTGLDGGGTSGDVTLDVEVPLYLSSSVTSEPWAAIKGRNTGTTNDVVGVWGESACPGGGGVFGWGTATTGATYGVFGMSASAYGGRGVYGYASATSGTTYGVYGETVSPSGYAGYFAGRAHVADDLSVNGTIYGDPALPLNLTGSLASTGIIEASNSYGTGIGVRGQVTATTATVSWGGRFESYTTSGRGVSAIAHSTTDYAYGVYAESKSTIGSGVYAYASATSGYAFGVNAHSASTDGRGVQGYADAASGTTHGVRGESASPDGRGVSGYASATTGATCGGRFQSASEQDGVGVYGLASDDYGYLTYGGLFENASRNVAYGVGGLASATAGVTYGVRGTSNSTAGYGVYGYAAANHGDTYGVYGFGDSDAGAGVYGESYGYAGVYGLAWATDGYGVYYEGGLAGSGTKSCVVKTGQGPTLLYCQESPECWFEDFGEGQLVGGRCHVELDPLFLETVTIDAANPMKVFVQPQNMGCKGMAVIPGSTGFDVGELLNGTSDAAFSYRVVAKRKGFEAKRLDYCKTAERDGYLNQELREKRRREHEQERARFEEQLALRKRDRARDEAERVRMDEERARVGDERRRAEEASLLRHDEHQGAEERARREQERRRAREDQAHPHAKPPGDQAE
jgi:hypothetical protein